MTRKRPATLDEVIAEVNEAQSLGLSNTEELYKPKLIAIGINDFLLKKLPQRDQASTDQLAPLNKRA